MQIRRRAVELAVEGDWGWLCLPPPSHFGDQMRFQPMKFVPYRVPTPDVDVTALGKALVDYVGAVGVRQAFSVPPLFALLIPILLLCTSIGAEAA
eukprot:3308291-Pyramimonas_sp.AAC.3